MLCLPSPDAAAHAMLNAGGFTAPIGMTPPEDHPDKARMKEIVAFTHNWFSTQKENLRNVGDIGGKALTVGYGLWTLDMLDAPKDETTDAMAEYLLKSQEPDGSWMYHSFRPPAASSKWMTTALAVYGLKSYVEGSPTGERAIAAFENAGKWINNNASPKSQEDLCGAIWLRYLLDETEKHSAPSELSRYVDKLLLSQRSDGGWAQDEEMESDAYATAQALVMLREVGYIGELPISKHDYYRRGIEYLRSTQQPDGSWHVKTRAVPVQEYFDNGDPHGKDQFISMMATAWATTALIVNADSIENPMKGIRSRRLQNERPEGENKKLQQPAAESVLEPAR